MAKRVEFEDMDSTGMFGHLMDDSAEKSKHARDSALRLLEMAGELEERASKLRHLAAVLILDAQEFAAQTGDLLAIEFPMGDVEPESEDPEEEPDDE
jgi:hypothetical protein